MVRIITDSTNDLTKELLDKMGVTVLPLYVNFGVESYKDGIEITTEKLYEKVKEKNELPKTAAVSVADFIAYFKDIIDKGDEIVFTGISSEMSTTYNNAKMAASELEAEDKIFVVDSRNLSTGIGLLVLKAVKDRDKGLSAKEIAENMKRNTSLVLSQFAIEQMDYLHKGGRCSGVAAFAASLLRIKPIIEVRNGKMDVQAKPIGKIKVALDRMFNQLVSDKDRLDRDHILLTHSIAPESAAYLTEKIKNEFPDVDLIETVAGCVISSHCGPGTIGILYMIKEDK